MRIAFAGASTAGAELAERLARSGHQVALAPAPTASAAAADVVVVAAEVSQAESAVESAARQLGPGSFVVALYRDATSAGGPPRVTLGDLSHDASARVVHLALALRDAGIDAEVSLDVPAAIVRLRSLQAESAGGDGPDACRRC
jgi:ketopantoate reductase